jgi:hypothetical protein
MSEIDGRDAPPALWAASRSASCIARALWKRSF